MARISTMTFTGQSGAEYKFEVWPRDTIFPDVGGVYIFSKRDSQRRHTVLYVGQTNSFKDRRLQHHEKWKECANQRGGNVICTYQESSTVRRLKIESDLIDEYDPPCNKQ